MNRVALYINCVGIMLFARGTFFKPKLIHKEIVVVHKELQISYYQKSYVACLNINNS